MQEEGHSGFELLKKQIAAVMLESYPGMNPSVSEWRGQEITDFQEDLRQKVNAHISEKAKLKVADFSDYLKILTDTTLEKAFREQAGKMVCGLFVSSNTELFFTRHSRNEPESIRAGQLTRPDKTILNLLTGFTADSVMINEPLTSTNDTVYSGTLSFLAGNNQGEGKLTIRRLGAKLKYGSSDEIKFSRRTH